MMFWMLITARHFFPICGRDAINPTKMPNFDPFLMTVWKAKRS